MSQNLKNGTLCFLLVSTITFLIYAAHIGKIVPIEGADFITSVNLCESDRCDVTKPQSLPYYFYPRAENKAVSKSMSFNVTHDAERNEKVAIYFPKFIDDIAIWVNDETLRQVDKPGRLWNKPLIIEIPSSMLVDGLNAMRVKLYGPAQEGLDLYAFHFGPKNALKLSYQLRWLSSIGVAGFSFGLMMVLGSALIVIWLGRRADKSYLWLGLSCLSSCIFLYHFTADTGNIDYKLWTGLWALSLSLFVMFIMKFLNRFLGFGRIWVEEFYVAFVIFGASVLALLPADYTFIGLYLMSCLSEFLALCILTTFVKHRHSVKAVDFWVFFACLSVSAALGLYGLVLWGLFEPNRSHQLFHFAPFIMAAVCLWLILSQMLRNIENFEQMNISLQQIVEDKTEELSESYESLARVQRLEAINHERQRIMLDLHDGIGGQLVNTLAYMENRNVGDTTLKDALEDALRDLALMLDSLESSESITTLLGKLRIRLENLLEQHGLEFDWQIQAEPNLRDPSPSNNLHLTRIVQEAITNIVKHANATIIQVSTDANSVTISDNGSGFDMKNLNGVGHGLMGMKKRARQIGAELNMISSDDGTNVQIVLKKSV